MLAALGLLASNGVVTGSATLNGQELIGAGEDQLNTLRGAKVTMIFQEPMTSLDPLYTIGQQIIAVIRRHRRVSAIQARAEAWRFSSACAFPMPRGVCHPTRMKCRAGSASAS